MLKPLENKRLLITGGTGSLGRRLLERILTGEMGNPQSILIFSRDEAKQHDMRLRFKQTLSATDEIIYQNFNDLVQFFIGDVRNEHALAQALRRADTVFCAAALKQVPTCEYFPGEAVLTNVMGAENLIRIIAELELPIQTVIGISTDKACKPVNVMGMTKAIQERIYIQGNLRIPHTSINCVRYGNVMSSRGSVIPLFHNQIQNGGPITITTPEMTRFLMSLDDSVDIVFKALTHGGRGLTYIPKAPACRITDLATALVGDRAIRTVITGIRPGEKLHEILISEEECIRTQDCGDHLIIYPILPELRDSENNFKPMAKEYASFQSLISQQEVKELLDHNNLLYQDAAISGAVPAI